MPIANAAVAMANRTIFKSFVSLLLEELEVSLFATFNGFDGGTQLGNKFMD